MSNQVDLDKPLMPKAKAIWLIENTALSFEQIAAFCAMHAVEIQALADEDIGRGMVGRSPIDDGELTQEEIDRCQANTGEFLRINRKANSTLRTRSKGPRYTPVSKRGDKPNAIAWLLKNHDELSDAQICKLVGTTKPTIKSIREKTHANMQNIKPHSPADLGLCTYVELDEAIKKALKAKGIDPEQKKKEMEDKKATEAAEYESSNSSDTGFDFSAFMSTSASSSQE
ncbi:MAG: DUF1013 domain-containing protein [Pseudomonadota bacterium]|jgi:hypothetical protein|nr:DUF1013 domain-containing protein [Pseudomonadota bacterium]MEC9235161.1 DUF1013 domain-containing protein [Pseudomonadota bacterium]MED5422849.1 DUF1013 domain-containing protein [Pseudomonadota bacterium]